MKYERYPKGEIKSEVIEPDYSKIIDASLVYVPQDKQSELPRLGDPKQEVQALTKYFLKNNEIKEWLTYLSVLGIEIQPVLRVYCD